MRGLLASSRRDTGRVTSQENVLTVRRAYESLARRDWKAMSRDAHRDFVIHTQLQGSYRGPDAWRRFAEDRTGGFDSWTLVPEGFLPHEDRVEVFLRSRSRLEALHTAIVMDISHVWTLRDRALFSLHTFARRADAVAAFGQRQ